MKRTNTTYLSKCMYEACKTCPENIPVCGICGHGYENFYCGKIEGNGCEKCRKGKSCTVT